MTLKESDNQTLLLLQEISKAVKLQVTKKKDNVKNSGMIIINQFHLHGSKEEFDMQPDWLISSLYLTSAGKKTTPSRTKKQRSIANRRPRQRRKHRRDGSSDSDSEEQEQQEEEEEEKEEEGEGEEEGEEEEGEGEGEEEGEEEREEGEGEGEGEEQD